MEKPAIKGICARILQLRLETTGPRGKAAFAKKLGLAPSTYDYYEASRVPPADVLVRIAEAAGVDLTWLLTGHSGGEGPQAGHPVVQRAAALLAEHPNAAPALAAFLEILIECMRFPEKTSPSQRRAAAADPEAPVPTAADSLSQERDRAETPVADGPDREWIPVLGRSAAGVPQFWSDDDAAAGVTSLADLIRRHCDRPDREVSPATAADQEQRAEQAVQIITVRGAADQEVVEFVSSAGLKTRYPDAFAVRIDGDSMSPSIRHGDLVVVSPSQPARDGQPAVVQLDRQIGVTCKLYRRTGRTVHLVPVNEQFPPQSVPVARVRWACRVVARVRS